MRYVLVHKGAPAEMTSVLDATPGLSRLSQQDDSALWRVDQQVSRAAIVPKSGDPQSIAAGPVELHTTIPAGADGRVLRLADTADEGWTATLDGKPLTRTTVDGWAQGFELPTGGGKLDVTFDAPLSHTAWLWAQGALAVVLVVMALPGRRRDVDDDLPEEEVVSAQDVTGDGRRARRLRAQAEADQADQSVDTATDTADGLPPQEEEVPVASAAVPQQQAYGEWDTPSYASAEYGTYGGEQYQGQQQYQAGTYEQPYQADPYQSGQYDPYAYGGTTQYDQTYNQGYDTTGQGYDPAYDPSAQPPMPPQPPHGTDSERPDGSQQ